MVFSISWYSNIKDADLNTLRNALYCGNMPKLELSSANIRNFEKLIETGELKSVRALDISVKDEDVPSLCRILDSLKSLTYVRCDMNYIISGMQLIADCFESCKSLNRFHVANSGYNSVLNVISRRNDLQSLELTGCFQAARTRCIAMLNPESVSYLQTVTFDRTYVGLMGADLLCNYLRHCKYLCYLNLSHSGIANTGAIALAEGLKNHTSLKELSLGSNSINFSGLAALVPVMKRNHLQRIDFSDNMIYPGAIALVYGAMHVDALRCLSLNCTELGTHVFDKASFVGLKYYKQLTVLNIGQNLIGLGSLPYLAEGLQHCTNLKELSLNFNSIDADGIPSVVTIMKSCKYLRHLDLAGNNIDVKGAAVLVGGWPHKSPL